MTQTPTRLRPRGHDPRLYQIAVLSGLLIYGLLALDLEVRPLQIALSLGTALAVQWLASRLAGLPRFDPRSAFITGLSLSLLLRAASPLWVAAAAAIAIAGKFLLRVRGKHVFNPANLGLAATMLVTDAVWVSPGQWGSVAFFAFLVAGLGLLVVHRAARSDVTWAFFAAYTALLFGRAAWLGDPLAVPLHQLSNGAFLIFGFYMISDPKTTPDHRLGRVVYATLVAALALYLQFGQFRPEGLIWALFFASPLVPLTDVLFRRFGRRRPGSGQAPAFLPASFERSQA